MKAMPLLPARLRPALFGLLGLAGCAWYFAGSAQGERQTAATEKMPIVTVPRKGESDATPIYFGVTACSQVGCHGDKEPRRFDPKEPIVCKCNEVAIWKQRDLHSVAY